MKKNYYHSIDLVKIMCAVMIVCIHTSPLASYDSHVNSFLVNCICRVAVPFFFISSGFLLFKRAGVNPVNGSTVKNYLKRILVLYLFWSAVYFPITAVEMYRCHDPKAAGLIFLNWLKNMIFTAGYGFLWYLPATIAAVAVVGLLLKKGVSVNKIIAAGLVLFLIGLCGQTYYGLVSGIPFPQGVKNFFAGFYDIIGTTRNGIFEGIIFVALGARLSQKEHFGKLKYSFLMLVISFALLSVEFITVSKMGWRLEYDMYLFLIPCAYYLLKCALCLEGKLKSLETAKWAELLRPYSSLIYFTHMIFVDGYCFLTPYKYTNSLIMFAIGILPTLLLSTAILLVSRTKTFGFVKKLY